MTAKPTDGRRARAQANREAAVQALLSLIRATGQVPTAEAVAAEAGLSRRTVFRLFRDLESLHLAAEAKQSAEVLARYPPPLPQPEPLAATLQRLVDHRAGVYELIFPMRQAAESLRHQHPFIARSIEHTAAALRMHLRALLAPHLPIDDDPRWQAAELLTSWHAWHTLRTLQGCTPEQAREIILDSLSRLLPA